MSHAPVPAEDKDLAHTGLRLGLLINFNVPLLKDGIKRLVW